MFGETNRGMISGKVIEVRVDNIGEFRKAVKEKVPKIIVTGKLARRLRPLTKVKVNNANLSYRMSKSSLISACTDIDPTVLITLIMSIGMVIIVALFLGYNIQAKKDANELEFTLK